MNRRTFLGSMGALGLSALGAGAADAPGGERPNIIVILADDMGFSDIGCFGGEIETPNLDRFAAGGMRFTQAYSCARCCPTRASLLTGLYPHQAGIGHMTNEADRRFDYGHPSYRGDLTWNSVTLAEVLGAAGYHTYMAGKWHVGTPRGMWPRDRGFEHYFGIIRGACNYFKPGPDKLLTLEDTPVEEVPEDFYTTNAFTNHAIRFIEAQTDDAPFFLYLAYNAPHWPLNALPEDVEKYRQRYGEGWDALREERFKRQREMGMATEAWRLSPRDARVPPWSKLPERRREELALRMALYAAQVDRMDQNIGRLADMLEKSGKLDNTLILFLSDNGACAEGKKFGGGPAKQLGTKEGYFLTYGRGWANASNTPFQRYKHWVHEGGIASPMIAHWPKGMKSALRGGICREAVHLIDFMPTLAEVANAEYPEEFGGHRIPPMEGRPLSPLLRGEAPEPRTLFWEHEGNRAVRQGKWKLVSAHARGDKQWHLYDLETDRSELNDLKKRHPERAHDLAARYAAWAERCGVLPWPVEKRPPA